MDPASYATQLKGTMRALRCTPTRRPLHSRRHADNSLSSASHVFVRHVAVRKPLQQPYGGPYLILGRSDRFYTLDLNGHTATVSIDRLKPAYIDFPHTLDSPSSISPAQLSSSTYLSTTPTPKPPTSSEVTTRTTRSGRHVHWPEHLKDFAL